MTNRGTTEMGQRRGKLRVVLALALSAAIGLSSGAQEKFSGAKLLNSDMGAYSGQDVSPSVVDAGGGRWVTVWQSDDPLGVLTEDDYGVVVSRSDDRGDTWSKPIRLDANSAQDGSQDRDPVIVANGSGTLVVGFARIAATEGTSYGVPMISRSNDQGESWSTPMVLPLPYQGATTFGLRLAGDGTGRCMAIYKANNGVIYGVSSTDNGETWNVPKNVFPYGSGDWGSQVLATDRTGNWYAVCADGSNVYVTISDDLGATWSTPVVVYDAIAQGRSGSLDGGVALTCGAGGTVVVAGGGGPYVWCVRRANATSGWSAPVEWLTYNGVKGVAVATDGNAGWVISDIVRATVECFRSSDNGANWSSRASFVTPSSGVWSGVRPSPGICTDGVGAWGVVWCSDDTLGGTLGSDMDILMTVSPDDGATWRQPVALNRNAGTEADIEILPDAACDGAGNWVSVWTVPTLDGLARRTRVSTSDSNGCAWTTPVDLVPYGGSRISKVATDRKGTWMIGTGGDIELYRSTDDGQNWARVGLASTATGIDFSIAADESGTWLAVLSSTDTLGNSVGSDSDILFVRSDDGGATWSTPAPLLEAASSDTASDVLPKLATDGKGTWVAVWYAYATSPIWTEDVKVACSTDDGVTWELVDTRPGKMPSIAHDELGNWMMLFLSDNNTVATAGSQNGPANWGPNSAVAAWETPNNTYTQSTAVVSRGSGEWLALWPSTVVPGLERVNMTLQFAHTHDNGQTWDDPQIIESAFKLLPQQPAIDSISLNSDGSGLCLGMWSSSGSYGHSVSTEGNLYTAIWSTKDDTDLDGIADSKETGTGILVSVNDTGTDPFNPDSDGDGMADGWEARYGLDPNDDGSSGSGENGGSGDIDGDGYSNLIEYAAGTNPRDVFSNPGLVGQNVPVGGGVGLVGLAGLMCVLAVLRGKW